MCRVHNGSLGGEGPPRHRIAGGQVNDHQLSPLADAYVLVALHRAGSELDRLRVQSGGLDKLFGTKPCDRKRKANNGGRGT